MKRVDLTKNKSGFTLFETMIYVALFGILVGTAVLSSFEIISSIDRSRKEALLEIEGNFLLQKVAWALSQSTSVHAAAYGATSTSLLVHVLYPTLDTFLFTADSSSLLFSKVGTRPEPLTSGDSRVVDVSFLYSGTTTEYVTTYFILESNSSDGEVLRAKFSGTNYLNK